MHPQLWVHVCFNQFLKRKTTRNVSRFKRRNTNSHMRVKDAWEFIRTNAHLWPFDVHEFRFLHWSLFAFCMYVVASASISVLHITFHVLLQRSRLNNKQGWWPIKAKAYCGILIIRVHPHLAGLTLKPVHYLVSCCVLQYTKQKRCDQGETGCYRVT